MKFGEYVGHKKSKEIKKKIVQTSIGSTEEEFLRKLQEKILMAVRSIQKSSIWDLEYLRRL
jgi:hypothetical protein